MERRSEEVSNRLIATDKLLKVWLALDVTNLDRFLTADQKLSYTILDTVERNVVATGHQTRTEILTHSASLNGKINQTFVVLVVQAACFLEGWVGSAHSQSFVEVSLRNFAAVIQLIQTDLGGTLSSQIQGKQTSGSLSIANISIPQCIRNIFQVCTTFRLNDLFNLTVWTLDFLELQIAVACHFSGKRMALISHTSEVHNISGFQGVNDALLNAFLNQLFQRSPAVNELNAPSQTHDVGLDAVYKAFLASHNFVSDSTEVFHASVVLSLGSTEIYPTLAVLIGDRLTFFKRLVSLLHHVEQIGRRQLSCVAHTKLLHGSTDSAN